MLPYKSRSLATPKGEVLAMLCLEVLMRPKAERRAKFPLRGKGGALAPKGVHFHRPTGRLACFPPGEARLFGFLSATAINSHCRHCPAPTKGARCRRQHLYCARQGTLLSRRDCGIHNSPLNQPALWAEPEPPRAKPDGGLNPGAAGASPPCFREYVPAR